MGGLYSLTKAGVIGLMQKVWGAKVPVEYDSSGQPVEGGQMKDSGVQEFANELIARLSSQDPIQMPDTLTLIAPPTGPAIQIVTNNNNIDGGIVIINEITNEQITINENTITINDIVIDETGTAGFTGSLTFITGVSFSAVSSISGCTVTTTVTPDFTTTTLNFVNGLLTGTS